MRRILFVTLVVVMLLSVSTSVFAAPPQRPDQLIQGQLGEVWGFYFGGFAPGERVDAFMFRPSTEAGWPFVDPPVVGSAWAVLPESQIRRQSWPAFQNADGGGFYFTMFMLPRDEVWYPCSFPLKWKCGTNSPATQPFEAPLVWPYASNPMNISSPVEVWLVGASGFGWIIPFEITGYYWKVSDLQ
jgi:hypothetical protein